MNRSVLEGCPSFPPAARRGLANRPRTAKPAKLLILALAGGLAWFFPNFARAAEPVQLPELLDVLKANLAGISPVELNNAAVAGLLEQLGSRAMLVDDRGNSADSATGESNTAYTNRVPVAGTIFERNFGYVRLATLGAETAREFKSTVERLMSTNRLRGLVLDLRFTRGGDNTAALAVADAFFDTERDLADWGEGVRRSTTKSNALAIPTAVLVNRETAGAAEILAGVLRQGEAALLVGTNTAGQAGTTREFTLKTGQRLRVAVAPVKVMGDRDLAFTGLKPDILASVDPQEERLFMADAYRVVRAAGGAGEVAVISTNRPRRRINEAELVRLAREAQESRDTSNLASVKAVEAALAPVITDPVLARALDVLKGLAVVQRFRGRPGND